MSTDTDKEVSAVDVEREQEQEGVLQLEQDIPFTQVSNNILNNAELSLKAKGLYSYLFSKATIAGWRFKRRNLTNTCRDGKKSLDSGMKELRDAGYLTLTPRKKLNGAFDGYIWILHFTPKKTQKSQSLRDTDGRPPFGEARKRGVPESGSPRNGVAISNTEVNNTNINKTEKIKNSSGKKSKEDPNAFFEGTDEKLLNLSTGKENSQQVNALQSVESPKPRKKRVSDYKKEAGEYYVSKERGQKDSSLFVSYTVFDRIFEVFRESSRGGKGKESAFIAWQELLRIETYEDLQSHKEIISKILEHIQESIKSDRDWKAGYAPLFSTYLNQRRWEDDIKKSHKLGDPSDFSDEDKRQSSKEIIDREKNRFKKTNEQTEVVK